MSINPGDLVRPLPIDHADWVKAWGRNFPGFDSQYFESDACIGEEMQVLFTGKTKAEIQLAGLVLDEEDPTLIVVWPVSWLERVRRPKSERGFTRPAEESEGAGRDPDTTQAP